MILILADFALSIYLSVSILSGIFDESPILVILLGIALTAIFILLGLMLIMLVSSAIPTKETANEKINLYSLRNNTETTGSFFLGIGTLEDVQTAFFSTKEDDGAIVFKHVPLEDVKIYEDQQEAPYYVEYVTSFKNPSWSILIPDIFGESDRTDFHVPSGSVLHNYSLK